MIFHKGRGDLILGSENFEQYFEEQYKDKTVRLPIVLHRDTLHMMYSKKTVPLDMVKKINEIITEELGQELL